MASNASRVVGCGLLGLAVAAGALGCAAGAPASRRAPVADDATAGALQAASAVGAIATICGGDSSGSSGDGAPAAQTRLSYPVAVAYDSSGRLLVVDTGDHRVLRVGLDGLVTTILGSAVGHEHPHGAEHQHGDAHDAESGAAVAPAPHHPYGIAVAPDGSIIIAGNLDPRIYRISPDGAATVIAGSDSDGFGGDGGPAAAALLSAPLGVAIAPDGGILIADTGNHRIRCISPDGIIETIAGTGERGDLGDGGRATAARLSTPFRVSIDPRDGSILIADMGNNRIRRVGPDGMIETIAGTGEAGFAGDGGPAIAARLNVPEDARVGPDGALYIADSGNHRVRRVRADGVIETVAGDGTAASRGDGGDARAASLRHPSGLAFDASGALTIAEAYGHRVRRVSLGPPRASAPPRRAPAPGKTNR